MIKAVPRPSNARSDGPSIGTRAAWLAIIMDTRGAKEGLTKMLNGIADLTLQEWGIITGIYGAVFTTACAAWQVVKRVHHRRRVSARIGLAYTESYFERLGDGFHERWYLTFSVRNRSPQTIRIVAWSADAPTKGAGPTVALDQPDLTLGPFEEGSFDVFDPDMLGKREPRMIFVQDERGREWKLGRKAVREAIDNANAAMRKNAERTHEPSPRIRAVRDRITAHHQRRHGSIFVSAPTGGSVQA